MELLLNLTWVLLALPAYWLWRDARGVHAERKFTPLQCLLALGCVLVILFPVISATDDLCVMRAEMEESPCSKRSIGQSTSERIFASKSQAQPALAVTTHTSFAMEPGANLVIAVPPSKPSFPAASRAVRAPPLSLLG